MGHEIVDLRSDTVTKPSLGMRRAIADAEVGDDVFGDDPTVKELESLAASIAGQESALFVPSGTMGNEVAILSHTQRGDEVIVEFDSHIFNYETAGPAVMSGVQLLPIRTERGWFSISDLENALRPDDVHEPVTRLICLENTHNRKGGRVLPIEDLKKIRDFADCHGLKIHMDGARIFNAACASGASAKDYCLLCDSTMFCLSKGLGAPIGSMLVGSSEFIERARRYRKMLGGGMRQTGVIAAAGIYALANNVGRLGDDHRRARALAEGISGIGKIELVPNEVETNIVVVDVGKSGKSVEEVILQLEQYGVRVVTFGKTRIRAVTHLDIDDEDIERAVEAFRRVFAD
ncbi:MAG: low-specificity L-threonine aldolase [bacterium]